MESVEPIYYHYFYYYRSVNANNILVYERISQCVQKHAKYYTAKTLLVYFINQTSNNKLFYALKLKSFFFMPPPWCVCTCSEGVAYEAFFPVRIEEMLRAAHSLEQSLLDQKLAMKERLKEILGIL